MKPQCTLLLAAALLLNHAILGATTKEDRDLVLQGAKVYPSATATPIDNASVVIHHGQIAAIGRRTELKII
jgi:hypothetical protein